MPRPNLTIPALAVLLLVAPAFAADAPKRALRYPSLSPDGKQVVFCYRGDVWVAPRDGKSRALRLTLHEAQETLTRVSPDGTQIAFSSRRNGGYDIFLVPVAGGVPKQITFHSAAEIVCDWSPDGKSILFMSERDAGEGRIDLYEVGIDGGTPRRVTRDGGRDGTYSPDGKWVVYVRGFNDIYWDDYEGSANYDICLVPVAGGTPRELTRTPGNERYPAFSKDGKTIYFVAEEKGVANFYSMPVAGGERTQLTTYAGADVHRPDLAWDFRTVVFEREGQLYTADLASPAGEPTPIPVEIVSDVRHSGIQKRTITAGGEQVDISRAAGLAAFALRGDIWTMPVSGGTGKRVTEGPHNDQWPRFSPDGRSIAYFSNESGNNDLYVVDLASGKKRRLTTHTADDFFHDWSPDGRSLVFTSERTGNKEIWLIDLETGAERQLTDDKSADDDPTFSPDGKLIAFDSGRAGSQDIYVMNRDGTNVRRVTQETGYFQVPSFSPDGRMLVYEGYSPTTGRSDGLFVIEVTGGPSVMISRDGKSACWDPDGEYIYFHAERSRTGEGIYRTKAPESIEVGERVPFFGTVEVDLKEELGHLFDQAWSALKDGFYDAKMHGVDWGAMRDKYREMAIDAEIKSEFQNVIRQMLAELNASHLGIGGGVRDGSSVTPSPDQNGYLGLDFANDPSPGGGREIVEILPGGPADEAGLRVGDVVVSIADKPVDAKANLDRLTAGLVGKEVAIGFKPLSQTGLGAVRSVRLTPISWGALRGLRYRNWEKTCQQRVRDGTRGRVGYMHLTMMDGGNLRKFQQTVTGWNTPRNMRRVKGMVLDVRNNGGGNIHNQLMSVLVSRPLARIQSRNGQRQFQPTLFWDRPVVLLINERSFSDAEVFPHMFKAAGVGKVVGVPTGGGVIGTNDITLSDGSMFRVPRVGYWSMDGENLEGLGVKPDFLVRETPADRVAGRDPQLEKAIEVVLAEIEAREKGGAKPAGGRREPPKPKPEPEEPEARPQAEPTGTEAEHVQGDDLDTLGDARAGEWVRYRFRLPDGEEETVYKVTISAVTEEKLEFDVVLEKGSQALGFPPEAPRTSLRRLLPSFCEVQSASSIDGEFRGSPTRFLVTRTRWPDGSELTLTFTNAVPGYGLLKVEMYKQVVMEAIEWGAPEGEPRPAPATGEAPPHPIHDAAVGEWVRIHRFRDGRAVPLVLRVVGVGEDEVILEQTLVAGDREHRAPDVHRKRDEKLVPPEGFTLVGYGEETLTVKGTALECVVMTATDPEGVSWAWYVCSHVAVNGYVKVVRGGETVVELVDWGFTTEG